MDVLFMKNYRDMQNVGAIPCGCSKRNDKDRFQTGILFMKNYRNIQNVGAIPCGCPKRNDRNRF
jgi:hypothetical protein